MVFRPCKPVFSPWLGLGLPITDFGYTCGESNMGLDGGEV